MDEFIGRGEKLIDDLRERAESANGGRLERLDELIQRGEAMLGVQPEGTAQPAEGEAAGGGVFSRIGDVAGSLLPAAVAGLAGGGIPGVLAWWLARRGIKRVRSLVERRMERTESITPEANPGKHVQAMPAEYELRQGVPRTETHVVRSPPDRAGEEAHKEALRRFGRLTGDTATMTMIQSMADQIKHGKDVAGTMAA